MLHLCQRGLRWKLGAFVPANQAQRRPAPEAQTLRLEKACEPLSSRRQLPRKSPSPGRHHSYLLNPSYIDPAAPPPLKPPETSPDSSHHPTKALRRLRCAAPARRSALNRDNKHPAPSSVATRAVGIVESKRHRHRHLSRWISQISCTSTHAAALCAQAAPVLLSRLARNEHARNEQIQL